MFLKLVADAAKERQQPLMSIADIPPRNGAAEEEVLAERCKSIFFNKRKFAVVVVLDTGEIRMGIRNVDDVLAIYRDSRIRFVHALPRAIVDDLAGKRPPMIWALA